jgi:hypothetical protein
MDTDVTIQSGLRSPGGAENEAAGEGFYMGLNGSPVHWLM